MASTRSSSSQPQSSSASLDVVIIGGGIMGLCTAYHLLTSQPQLSSTSTVTLIENSRSCQIANGASSKAGGFIARDWHKNQSTFNLAQLSWECHQQMSLDLDGQTTYGWQTVPAIGFRVGGDNQQSRSKYRQLPNETKNETGFNWLNHGDKQDLTNGKGGAQAGIAQIDPAQFCQTVYRHLSLDHRFKTVFGTPESLSSKHNLLTVRSTIDSNRTTTLPVSKLVITAGPWSSIVCRQLGLPEIELTNLPGHSLLIKPALRHVVAAGGTGVVAASSVSPLSITRQDIGIEPVAIFAGIGSDAAMGVEHATGGTGRLLTEREQQMGYTEAPELFTRLNGIVYVAGENTTPNSTNSSDSTATPPVAPNRLPDNVDDVDGLRDDNLLSRLIKSAEAVSPLLQQSRGAIITARQASCSLTLTLLLCYRPKTFDGECMIGPLCDNVYIATGHGPWGITLAPGTGKLVSEMILNSTLSANIPLLSAERFKKSNLTQTSNNQSTLPLARL
ncbi:hypothetical protein OIO90_005564 [Microbotryomycetes sp. JL221]|nr:hypothetical protein OIO90_005564 [Microbotryomycetes sp. JL221]